MFNWVTMSELKFSKMFFDSPENASSSTNSQETYENSSNEQLKKIRDEINELKDADTDNDKIEIQWTLTWEFAEYLKDNREIATALNDAIKNIEVTDENKQAIEDLKNFLAPIISGTFDISGMNEIQASNEKGEFANKVNEAVDGQTSKIDNLKSSIDGYLSVYSDILSMETDIKNTLEKVKMVLENPVSTNVKILQNVIYDNLTTKADKIQFLAENRNKKNYTETDKFDWKFWNHMVVWTDKWLKIIEERLKSLKSAKDVMDKNEVEKILSQITEKTDIKADKDSNPNSWFDGLPDGYSVDFESDAEKAKLNTPSNEIVVIKVNIKQWDEIKDTREISLIVVDKVETNPEQTPEPVNTAPLDYGDGKHLVISNGPKIAGATFYSLEATNSTEDDWWLKSKELNFDKDTDAECFMVLNWDPDKVYKVKVDKNGGLCPLIENVKSTAKLLLKNNPSCIAYLQNKINGLPWYPQIAWNPKLEDYVIRSYERGLTIEPMTLDGNWVSEDLSQCLAYENFTNFLRWAGSIDGLEFDPKNDPNLKLDNDKLYVRVKKWQKRGDEKSERWYEIKPGRFWIYDTESLKKFIRYNNHEHWEDNWDRKRDNKGYGKIDLK